MPKRSLVAPDPEGYMNDFLFSLSVASFLLIPPVVFWIMLSRPRRARTWWIVMPLVVLVGWAAYLGFTIFYYAALGDELAASANPDPELMEHWGNDGAKLIFALFGGWIPALLYSAVVFVMIRTVWYLRGDGGSLAVDAQDSCRLLRVVVVAWAFLLVLMPTSLTFLLLAYLVVSCALFWNVRLAWLVALAVPILTLFSVGAIFLYGLVAREPATLGETSTAVTVILAIQLIVIPLWIVALSWLNRSALAAILRKQVTVPP
jgi:hypothetical protein